MMDVSNWSNESVLEDEDKVEDQKDDGKKPKIGFLGGCLIAVGGFFLLLLTICGGMFFVTSNEKYPQVYISNNPIYLEIGSSYKLEADFQDVERSKLTWSSSDPTIMSVSDKGEIRGLKTGVVTIKAETIKDSLVGTTDILVLKSAKSFTLKSTQLKLKVGQIVPAGYVAIPKDANIYMYSDFPAIAGVSGQNIVALTPGTTKIHFVKGLSAERFLSDQSYGEIEVTVSQ